MAKDKSVASRPWLAELFQFGIYKRNQGRIARQVTFFAVAIGIAIGCYQLSDTVLTNYDQTIRYGVPFIVAVLGWWVTFRIVNVSSFADFLISVEAEMAKVSWPGRSELLKASVVVLIFIIVLAAVLFIYDLIWDQVFSFLGLK
ncbi:MAG: preprotein translocase subunit SecE [Pirellulales bacterium]